MTNPKWIGFDLGGTKMMASVVNAEMEVLGSARKPTKGNEGVEKGIKRILELIEEALQEHELKPKDLGGIGMACPGVVDLNTGILRRAPNLGWDEVPIGAELEEHFKVPVSVLNDVDAGAFGEYAQGAGRDAQTLLAVFPGTGIGAGCVMGGKILTGPHASCMEIGNMRLPVAGLHGELGEPPRLEAICGRLGIAAAAAIEAYRGNAPVLFKSAGTDLATIKSKDLAKAIEGGDEAIEQIVRNAAYYLGLAIGGVVDLLGPDVLVLGGGLVEKMPDLFMEGAREGIDRYSSPALAREVEVRQAALGDDAVVLGAAAYARDQKQRRKTKAKNE